MFRPLPSHADEFRSDDLDEIRAFIARFDGHHRRAALEAGPLGYAVRLVRCDEMIAGWGITRTRQRVEGVPVDAILHLPVGRRHIYATRGRKLEARPDTAILLVPGQEYALYSEPHDRVLMLRLPGALLMREVADRDTERRLATREIPLPGARLQSFAAFYRAVVEASLPGPGGRALASAPIEARLRSWVADQVLGARPSGRPAAGIERVRRVEEWIDAHLLEPITLGRLCAVAGVGDRFLESAFRSHRGQTPMQFVTGRRLTWVRHRLLEARPGDTVTQVAHDGGFVHLGRFAARYRLTYRESPSVTLQRRLRACTASKRSTS